MCADDWRDDPLFFERCRQLREVLRGSAAGEGTDASAESGASGLANAFDAPGTSAASSEEVRHA